MKTKVVRVGNYYYTLSLTELIEAGDWYMASIGGAHPMRSKAPPEGWGKSMLEGGIYLKIVHTSNPRININK